MPSSTPPIVDSHVHVWPFGLVHSAQRVAEPLRATPVDLLATEAGSGVDVTIMTPANVYPDNGYVLGAAATEPRRLRAAVGMDPRRPDVLAQLRAYAQAGAIGVRIVPAALPLEGPDDMAALGALADLATDLGLVIQWTAGLPRTGGIDEIASRRPDAVQVLDHLGLPPDATDLGGLTRIRQLASIPGLSVKLSGLHALSRDGYPFRDAWNWAEGVFDAFGPDRMMWASDWPLSGEFASHAQLRGLVDELPFLDGASRTAILSTTACRVWSIPPNRSNGP